MSIYTTCYKSACQRHKREKKIIAHFISNFLNFKKMNFREKWLLILR